jgi:type I restriction enzyme S subunit
MQKWAMEEYRIGLPEINEQNKIAAILSSYDELINQKTVKFDKLKILKKGLMNDLLTGKVRVKVKVK